MVNCVAFFTAWLKWDYPAGLPTLYTVQKAFVQSQLMNRKGHRLPCSEKPIDSGDARMPITAMKQSVAAAGGHPSNSSGVALKYRPFKNIFKNPLLRRAY